MKLMIASDIHGGAYHCEKMCKCYSDEQADKLILLGDLLYHGPRNDLPKGYDPKQVIQLLNNMKQEILCVHGNCDSEVDQMVLDFPILSDYALIFEQGRTLVATHGHITNIPALKSGDVLLSGHTHVPKTEKIGDYWHINPGSVSLPKEGSVSSYIIFENNCVTLKALDGSILKQTLL